MVMLKRICLLTLMLIAWVNMAISDDSQDWFYPGKLIVIAADSVISLPKGINGLFLTACESGPNDDTGQHLFLGSMRVDSIVRGYNLIDSVGDGSFMDSVSINSAQLLDCFFQIGVTGIFRSIPNRTAEDTLVYDSVRQVWHSIPICSVFYHVHFPDSLKLDSIVSMFKELDGVDGVGRIPIPITD